MVLLVPATVKGGQHADARNAHRGFGQQYAVVRRPRTGAHTSTLGWQHVLPQRISPFLQQSERVLLAQNSPRLQHFLPHGFSTDGVERQWGSPAAMHPQ